MQLDLFAPKPLPKLSRITPRDYQQEGIDKTFDLWRDNVGVLFRQPTGCHAKGQKVLMFDGTTKVVEEIAVGDWLMGPDSLPRVVTSLARGRGQMVRIVPIRGRSFVVNLDHILTLVKTNEGERNGKPRSTREKIVDVSVREWLAWPQSKKHLYKLFRVGVEFAVKQELPIDPYFLGVLLGDGSFGGSVSVTTSDNEVVELCHAEAKRHGLSVREEAAGGRSTTYYLTCGDRAIVRNELGQTVSQNPLSDLIRRMGLRSTKSDSKFIPINYLRASRRERLELLAGLIDTDGSRDGNDFDYISKSVRLAADVQFLARSLGLSAYARSCEKTCTNNGAVGIYYRVSISGHTDMVPCRIERKRCQPRKQKKDALRTGFSVELLGEDDYYGFSLTGDGRFLLGDFFVTHNTGKTVSGTLIADRWLQQGEDYRVLVLAHERQLIQQFAEEIEWILGERPKIEMGDEHCRGDERIIVASRQTLYVKGEGEEAVSRLYKFDPSYRWLVVIDEAHRWARKLKSCRPIVEHFEQNPQHRRLGLTATPERTDKTTLAGLFPAVASDYRLFDVDGGKSAVNDGWAVPYDQRYITVEGVDFKNIREVAKDFDKHELERILGESETLAKLCTPLLDLVGRRRTIIFNPGTAMARNVALYLNERLGYEAALSLDGSFPDDERKDIYKRHQSGEFQFLSVCGLCREGYNDPGIQCVAVFRPTKSRPLAEQMKGRGCRPLRGVVSPEMTNDERRQAIAASDKPNCMIVDLVGITGIADCASTASIMAGAKPDEVIQRANENIGKRAPSESIDVAEEIRNAERELEEEKEQVRKRQEEAVKARLEREARLQREREEAAKRARLQADVKYTERQVQSGGGGHSRVQQAGPELATVGQQKFLWVLGMRGDLSKYTKKQASRMIGQLKNEGLSPEHVAKVNPLPGSRKKTEPKQLNIDDINALFMEARRG